MTNRVKKDIINYIEAIGGIKTINHRDRIRYIKALISRMNSLEESGLYDKIKMHYDIYKK